MEYIDTLTYTHSLTHSLAHSLTHSLTPLTHSTLHPASTARRGRDETTW